MSPGCRRPRQTHKQQSSISDCELYDILRQPDFGIHYCMFLLFVYLVAPLNHMRLIVPVFSGSGRVGMKKIEHSSIQPVYCIDYNL